MIKSAEQDDVDQTLQLGKHVSNLFLKYKKWKLDRDSVCALLQKCIRFYYQLPLSGPFRQMTTWSPAHLAALLDDLENIKLFREKYPECLSKIYLNFNATPIMCAAYAGSTNCLEYFLQCGSNLNLEPVIRWAIKGGNVLCVSRLIKLHLLQNEPLNIRDYIDKDILGDNVDILNLLLTSYTTTPFQLQIGVHMAAGHGLCNVLLALIKAGASVNIQDREQLNPAHQAILKLGSDEAAFKVLQILLENGGDANYDGSKESPLYYAACRGFSKCAFVLIKHGAVLDTCTINKLNLKVSHFFFTHLNGLISMVGVSSCFSKSLVGINIRFTGARKRSGISESYFLNLLISDGQIKFLQHPVIETYLAVKWVFVRKFFLLSFISYVLTLGLFTIYVVDTYTSENQPDPGITEVVGTAGGRLSPYWWLSLVSILIRLSSNVLRLSVNPKRDLVSAESWCQWVLLISMIVTLMRFSPSDNVPYWQRTVCAGTILFSWAFLLNYVRRYPTLGLYVEMFLKVLMNLSKFILTYVCLLIGFVIAFMVLCKGQDPFTGFPQSVLRIMNMMVGEMAFDELFPGKMVLAYSERTNSTEEHHDHRSTTSLSPIHFIYAMFVITVTIALVNLLIGLAVSDIKGLRRRSKLHKTMREIAFITDLESFVHSETVRRILPRSLVRYLKDSIIIPDSHSTIYVYPHNSNDKRLPKVLKLDALRVAMKNRSEETGGEEDGPNAQIEAKLTSIQTNLAFLIARKRGL